MSGGVMLLIFVKFLEKKVEIWFNVIVFVKC